jgi:hypothetical protein
MLVCHINTFEGELFNARASVPVFRHTDISFRETCVDVLLAGQGA